MVGGVQRMRKEVSPGTGAKGGEKTLTPLLLSPMQCSLTHLHLVNINLGTLYQSTNIHFQLAEALRGALCKLPLVLFYHGGNSTARRGRSTLTLIARRRTLFNYGFNYLFPPSAEYEGLKPFHLT